MVLRRPSWLGKGGRREDEEDQDEEGEGGGLEGGDHGEAGGQEGLRWHPSNEDLE